MRLSAVFRRALVDLDVGLVRSVWRQASPHLPQPKDDAEALTALHMARTAAESLPLKDRAYSHRWLSERALPSQLPDHLKPSAERLYPVIVDAVGISVNSRYLEVKLGVRGAMEDAVLDCYANGDKEPDVVRPQMMAARERELRGLGLAIRSTSMGAK
jgi:hypothetical protein